MKYTNIKQFGCLLCIVALLAGCALYPKWLPHPQEFLGYGTSNWMFLLDLEVDGRFYRCSQTDCYDQGKHDYTYIHATLLSAENAKKHAEIMASLSDAATKGELKEKWTTADVNPIPADADSEFYPLTTDLEIKSNYFQIIDDESKEILFEIPLEELGISTRRGDRKFSEEKLKEAMTQLIRENVQPQTKFLWHLTLHP